MPRKIAGYEELEQSPQEVARSSMRREDLPTSGPLGAEFDTVANLQAQVLAASTSPVRTPGRAKQVEQEDAEPTPESPLPAIWSQQEDSKSDGTAASKYRFGKIFFEETGKTVPYVIAPNEAPPGVDDAAEIIRILVKHGGLKKPSIRFDVRARGSSYLEWASELYDNNIMARAWNWKDNTYEIDNQSKEQAQRSFGKKLLYTFQAAVQGVVDADGWFFFQAGRRPRHQLIGDAIDVYGGTLHSVTWVQYAALQYEYFGGKHNHDHLAKELIEKSVNMGPGVNPKPQSVIYKNEDMMYPDPADLQGLDGSAAEDFMAQKVQILESQEHSKDVPLHPHASHFIFYDTKGQPNKTKTGQHLPWDRVQKLEEYLSKQGIMEGVILANGDKSDFDVCARHTERSNPVVTLKSTGGAADVLAQAFERRIGRLDPETGDVLDHNSKSPPHEYPTNEDGKEFKHGHRFTPCEHLDGLKVPGLLGFEREVPDFARHGSITQGLPYPAEAIVGIPDHGKNLHFNHTVDLDDSELMLVDVVDPLCAQLLQRNMADMLTKSGGQEELKLGFNTSERSRLENAWDDAIIYQHNAKAMKLQASFFNYVMLLLNAFIVCVVIYKQIEFPDGGKQTCSVGADGQMIIHAAAPALVDADKLWRKNIVNLLLVCTPIFNGIVLTLNSQFSPQSKWIALTWASKQCVSEIYRYRTRIHEYSSIATTSAHLPEEQKWKLPEEKTVTSGRMFMDRLVWVGDQLSSDSKIASDSLKFKSKVISKKMMQNAGSNKNKMPDRVEASARSVQTAIYKQRKQVLDALPGGAIAKEDETAPDGTSTGGLVYEWKPDDGFSVLSSQSYIAVRTLPGLEYIEKILPGLGLLKKILQGLIYGATSVSVMLGTLHMDIYIAISTATISLLTGIMEYEKLERRIVGLNSSKNQLEGTLKWWHALSFVDRRQPANKDELVERTEEALLAEANNFYMEQNPRARARGKATEGEVSDPKKTGEKPQAPPADDDSDGDGGDDSEEKPVKGKA